MKSLFLFLFTFLVFLFPRYGHAQDLEPTLVKKLYPDFSSYPFGFSNYNGSMYFFASRDLLLNNNISLWKSDGSEAGTVLIKDSVGFKTSGEAPEIKVLNNQMYFLVTDYSADSIFLKLWKSDGTTTGTQVLRKSGRDYSGGSDNATGQLTLFNNKLFFNFYDASGGSEPFYSDGTVSGTQMLKDIQANPYGFNGSPSFPHRFTVVGNALYFWAIPFFDGFGLKPVLYKSDGTSANTQAVREFSTDLSQIVYCSHLVSFNGKVYFSAKDGAGSGYELWSTDGTEAGTTLVKEINPGSTNSGDGVSRIFQAQVFKNRLYFWAFDPASGHELWSTDGTSAGTRLLKNTHSSTIPSMNQQFHNSNPFFVWGGKMYYANNDGLKGREPWVTDGTAAGTRLFLDVNPGTPGSTGLWNPGFSVFQGNMYFRGFDGSTIQICQADTATDSHQKFPVSSGFFSADPPYNFQMTDYEVFRFHTYNNELYFQGGFHPTSGDPSLFSHDFFKLSPVPTGVENQILTAGCRIFPNPTSGRFWLKFEEGFKSEDVLVLNLQGSVVWKGKPEAGIGQVEIDLSLQPSGMYWFYGKGPAFGKGLRIVKW
jgi:ELWxxDGT repeat protein